MTGRFAIYWNHNFHGFRNAAAWYEFSELRAEAGRDVQRGARAGTKKETKV
jgi:hypothetical protein